MKGKRTSDFSEHGSACIDLDMEILDGNIDFKREYGFRLIDSKDFYRKRIANPDDCPQVYNNFEQLADGSGDLCISEIGFLRGRFCITYVKEDDADRVIEWVYFKRRIGMELEFQVKPVDKDDFDRHSVKFLYDQDLGNIVRIWERRSYIERIFTLLEDGKVLTVYR